MTTRVAYIGDKLTATGFNLSGGRIYTPGLAAEAIWDCFVQAREEVELILISQPYARLIGARLQRYQRRTPIPPVLCLPEGGGFPAPARATIEAAKTSLGLSQ